MNIPKYSLENRKVIYFFLAILLIGGVISFFKLPKKEDAPFVIKTAVLVTQYPGANPHEVEKLITEPIEREIQSMTDVYQIKSESYFGLSKISIELQPTIDPDYMPVKWDELRRKVANIQPKLPSGASTITVNDDFGDVYGIYYALTADEGFSYSDLRDWAQRIRTQLTPIEGVQKVMLYGEQTEVINVKISTSKLSALGIDPTSIMGILQKQNIQVNTGDIATEIYQLRLRTEGTYTSLEDIENQLIIEDVVQHYRAGADYLGIGPFRFTTTKKNFSPVLGLEGYSSILSQMKEANIEIPVVAIGGITYEDIPAILHTGVNGIALSGTILGADNPIEETRRILNPA